MKFVTLVSTLSTAVLSLWWPPGHAEAQSAVRSVLRQLYGDLAFEVRTQGQGAMTFGVADSRTSLVFTLMATDLRRWADSATRMLSARPPRRGQTARWDASVAGPGVAAGSMSLSRTITPTDTTIILLVTDTAFRALRTPLRMDEARALTAAMKRAASAAVPKRPAPTPRATTPPKKPPAAKPPDR
ncbi:MAG TPA: hypothetical protein VFZ73_09250 [Gemmatimonadaceae bacterium]